MNAKRRPFESDSRAPWRRTTRVEAPAGHGTVEIEKPRRNGPLSASEYGRKAERDAGKAYAKAGYTVTRSHLSRGKADFVAIGHGHVVQVQVKAASSDARFDDAVRACARDMLKMPSDARRVGCVYVYGRGEAVRLELYADGSFATSGRTTECDRADQALRRMRKAK